MVPGKTDNNNKHKDEAGLKNADNGGENTETAA